MSVSDLGVWVVGEEFVFPRVSGFVGQGEWACVLVWLFLRRWLQPGFGVACRGLSISLLRCLLVLRSPLSAERVSRCYWCRNGSAKLGPTSDRAA